MITPYKAEAKPTLHEIEAAPFHHETEIKSTCHKNGKRTGKKFDPTYAQLFRPQNKNTPPPQKPEQLRWKYLFEGKTLTPDKLPHNVAHYPHKKNQLIFAIWDDDLDTLRGDIKQLKLAFNNQTNTGFNLLRGGISIQGKTIKVYELRSHCETRILGAEVQEPGETPVIFFTLPCNHKSIDKNKYLAAEQALRKALDGTTSKAPAIPSRTQ